MSYTENIKRPFNNIKILGIVIVFYFIANAISAGSLLLDPVQELTPIKIGALVLSILISLIPVGYSLVCAKTAQKNVLPEFTNLKKLFTLGVGTMVVSMVYSIPFLLVTYALLSSIDITSLLAGSVAESIPQIILLLILILITILVIPVALVIYAKEESFPQAFNLKLVIKKVVTKKYVGTFIIAGVYTVLVSLVVAYINILTQPTIILPWLFSAISNALIAITVMTMYAKAVNV